jgi:deazaflavin-dependent oxidoreductase (nitroreductase family)
MPDWDALAREQYCYLTTTGRVSGEPREIEIWFGLVVQVVNTDGDNPGSSRKLIVYMLSGGRDRSDWVRNLIADPAVSLRIGAETLAGQARVVEDSREEALARDLLFRKYSAGYSGDLTDWRTRSLPIAVDLEADPASS